MRLLQRLADLNNLNDMYLEIFNFLKSYASTYNYRNILQDEKIKWSIQKHSEKQLDECLQPITFSVCTSKRLHLQVEPIILKYQKLSSDQSFKYEEIDNILEKTYEKYSSELFSIVKNACMPYIKELEKEYIPQDFSQDELNHILHLLYKYVINHLNDIINSLSLKKNEQGFYKIEWAGQDLNAYSLYEIIEPFSKYMDNHFNNIVQSFSLSDKLYRQVLNNKDKINDMFINNNLNIIRKIRNILIQKHKPIQDKLYKNFLEQNDDHLIGKEKAVKIDFNVLNDYIRERPIIIIRDTQGKDYVIFGHLGDSHSRHIQTSVKTFIKRNHIEQDLAFFGYAYLVRDVAFVENYSQGYMLEDQVNILKNDPRIRKVYTTLESVKNNGGYITRLAMSKIFL